MMEDHVAAGSARVADPVRLVAEHRHEVPLALVVRDDDRE
jgi:hypothetical protein